MKLFVQESDHHAWNAGFATKRNLRQYLSELLLVVAEIASAWTNQYEGLQFQMRFAKQDVFV